MDEKVIDMKAFENDSYEFRQLVPVGSGSGSVSPFSTKSLESESETTLSLSSENKDANDETATVAKQLELELVKSSAIVKYGLYSSPLQFLQLHSNTNLNKPPSNWLRSSSPMERYIRQMAQPKQRSPYASFQMGSSNLDQVGKMDVISDSENIKNLMKLPYSKTQPVSMMVHRIGNTLFLDDFDVQKNLLRQQQEDWKWLKKFYQETVMHNQNEEHEEGTPRPLKGRNVLQSRNMFSKFLYYSVEGSQGTEVQPEPELEAPEPASEPSDTPSPKTAPSSEFTRTVQWTFEDIRMLIGTDLPIFGGGTHPCVSLRLRDMRQPISVLTGLDYWLDNLMCNVPELAMCYHLDGIVQNYELVSTNDIPSLENSKFSPSVIRDVAQNMLSFLKTNVTKEGHTYWLFKGHNDDIIKLYDLTTLCSDDWETNSENPFTVPVGILLFRVARNIMNVYGREKSGTIRTLLKNCLTLLDPNTHAQVVVTACFMLADLYVKNDLLDQDLPKEREEVDDEQEQDQQEQDDVKEWNELEEKEGATRARPLIENRSEISLPVTSLCLSGEKPSGYLDVVDYAPMSGDTEERCQEALKIIVQGLTCVDKSIDSNDSQSEATQCSDEPIPLGYEKLYPNGREGKTSQEMETKCDDCSKNRATVLSPMRSRRTLRPWQEKYRLSLLQKAVYAYYWLGDVGAKSCKYGLSLRCMRNALVCFRAVTAGSPLAAKDDHKVMSALLTLCGDVHMMLAKEQCVQVHEDLYGLVSDLDKVIMSHAEDAASVLGWDSVQEEVGLMTRKARVHLSRANAAYSQVVELLDGATVASDGSGAVRRYGSSHNELGVTGMNELARIYAESTDESDLIKQHESAWTECLGHFRSAIQSFERIDDSTNIGLVHSNIARLMRVLAQGAIVYSNHERGEFSGKEKYYFLKAVDSYRSALSTLSSRDRCPAVWDSVRWELSSTYFNLATLLQDYAPLSTSTQSEIEKEVTTFMDKALKYCDTETETSRLPSCHYRAATIHHRLASLYHNSFRNQSLENKKKHLRMLAELHYEKACKYFQILESACELFRVTLERVAMCEFCLAGQTSPTNKMKSARQSLAYLLQCKAPLTLIRNQAMDSNSGFEGYVEESLKLSGIFLSRLQFTMLTLFKLTKSMKKSKTNEFAIPKLKQMYARTLQKFGESDADSPSLESARDTTNSLIEILDAINADWTVIERIDGQD